MAGGLKVNSLTLSTLGKIFSRRQIDDIFLIFPRKQDLTFQANCLLRRQFAWNVKSCFLGKIRKTKETICLKCQILFSGKNKKNIINLSSAENAQKVVKVKVPVTAAADNILFFFFFARQVIHIKCLSFIFVSKVKIKSKRLDCHLLTLQG